MAAAPTTHARIRNIAEGRWREPQGPTPEQISDRYHDAVRLAQVEYDREFGPAVLRVLRADLATWPRAFHGPVEALLNESWIGPSRLWDRYQRRRLRGEGGDTDSTADVIGCACGCRGFNSEVAAQIRSIRAAVRELRSVTKPAVRARRRDGLQHAKNELLLALWLYGVRHIDRARLRQHVAEAAQAQITSLREAIDDGRKGATEARWRLRENRKHNRNGPTDEPMSAGQRLWLERSIEREALASPVRRARAEQIEAALRDPHRLTREWTGCARVPVIDAEGAWLPRLVRYGHSAVGVA